MPHSPKGKDGKKAYRKRRAAAAAASAAVRNENNGPMAESGYASEASNDNKGVPHNIQEGNVDVPSKQAALENTENTQGEGENPQDKADGKTVKYYAAVVGISGLHPGTYRAVRIGINGNEPQLNKGSGSTSDRSSFGSQDSHDSKSTEITIPSEDKLPEGLTYLPSQLVFYSKRLNGQAMPLDSDVLTQLHELALKGQNESGDALPHVSKVYVSMSPEAINKQVYRENKLLILANEHSDRSYKVIAREIKHLFLKALGYNGLAKEQERLVIHNVARDTFVRYLAEPTRRKDLLSFLMEPAPGFFEPQEAGAKAAELQFDALEKWYTEVIEENPGEKLAGGRPPITTFLPKPDLLPLAYRGKQTSLPTAFSTYQPDDIEKVFKELSRDVFRSANEAAHEVSVVDCVKTVKHFRKHPDPLFNAEILSLMVAFIMNWEGVPNTLSGVPPSWSAPGSFNRQAQALMQYRNWSDGSFGAVAGKWCRTEGNKAFADHLKAEPIVDLIEDIVEKSNTRKRLEFDIQNLQQEFGELQLKIKTASTTDSKPKTADSSNGNSIKASPTDHEDEEDLINQFKHLKTSNSSLSKRLTKAEKDLGEQRKERKKAEKSHKDLDDSFRTHMSVCVKTFQEFKAEQSKIQGELRTQLKEVRERLFMDTNTWKKKEKSMLAAKEAAEDIAAELDTENDSLTLEKMDLKEKNTVLAAQVASLQGQTTTQSSVIQDLQNRSLKQQADIIQLQQDKINLANAKDIEIKTYKADKETMSFRCELLRCTVESQARKIQEQSAEIKELQKENAAQSVRIKELEDENAAQSVRIKELEDENAAQSVRIKELEDENATQSRRIEELEKGNAEKSKTISEQGKMIEDLRDMVLELRAEVTELKAAKRG